MSIWFKEYTLADLAARGANTMVTHLGIEVTELGPNFICGTMPVDHRTRQPHGILHGGASVAFAESLCSLAANLTLDMGVEYAVGLEINANHISSCRDGIVTGLSRPLHVGRTTQVWETHISQTTRLVCVSRMTLAILKHKR